jgi:hypothetical protein
MQKKIEDISNHTPTVWSQTSCIAGSIASIGV